MKAELYRDRWLELKCAPGKADPERLHHLSARIALSFLDQYYYGDTYDGGYIELLCEMATSGTEAAESAASSALFGIVIEGLCDDFEELQTEAYNRVMSQVVSFCRKIPQGRKLDGRLSRFGLGTYEDIYSRAEGLRVGGARPFTRRNLRKIIILSRVTVGADVAVTSVFIRRLMDLMPYAEIVLIGSARLDGIFGGNDRIRIVPLDYTRRGGLVERISSWHSVLKLVQAETAEFAGEDYVLLDTDSRLSQLGVLPLVESSSYLFFNSRGSDSYPKKLSMSELANHWFDLVFGKGKYAHPSVWLQEDNIAAASKFVRRIRDAGCHRIVAVNLGVGGNSRKRIEGEFEERLLAEMAAEGRTVVLLDRGFGGEEAERTGRLLKLLKKRGVKTGDAASLKSRAAVFPSGVLGVTADIGEIAALISCSDEFVGYDSACQHIAAAAGIPTCTIFAGSNNTRFVRRWRACGSGKSKLVHVDTLTQPRIFDDEDIIETVMDARR